MTTIEAARRSIIAEPITLLDITLSGGGPALRLSDRNVTVGGMDYENYLLQVERTGEELRRSDSDGRNPDLTLTLDNGAYGAYAHLIELGATYPFEGADVVLKECYIGADGVCSESSVIFRGIADEPLGADLLRFTLKVSGRETLADNCW